MADVYTSQPSTKDVFMDAGNPTTVNNGVTFSIDDLAAQLYRGLMTFDTTAYTGGSAAITSAVLNIYYISYSGTDPVGRQMNVFKMRRNDWVEAEGTWNSYKSGSTWTTAGCGSTVSDYDATITGNANVPASAGAFFQIDITDIVKDAIDNVSGIVNLLIKLDNETEENPGNYSIMVFASNTNATEANRPKLVITYGETYTIEASVGIFTLTGININLLRPIINMAVEVGEFTITGIDIALNRCWVIMAPVGQFILNGKDILISGFWKKRTKNSATWTKRSKITDTSWTKRSK